MFRSFLVTIFLITSVSAFSCPERGGFYIPKAWSKNKSYQLDLFMDGLDAEARISEFSFHNVFNRIVDRYRNTIESVRGTNLVARADWFNDEPNARAGINRDTGNAEIIVFGGLARHPKMSEDGLALVLCHEIGHLIGGYPRKRPNDPVFAAAEAQADYFSVTKCFRSVFGKDQNENFLGDLLFETESSADNLCSIVYSDTREYYTCLRSIKAAEDLAEVLTAFVRDGRGDPTIKVPQINTPDQTVVKKHTLSYPSIQCRFDTLVQGSLCDKGNDFPYGINDDYEFGYCTRKEGYLLGSRPKCWFSPEAAEFDLLLSGL